MPFCRIFPFYFSVSPGCQTFNTVFPITGNIYRPPYGVWREDYVFSLSVHRGGGLPVVQNFATRCPTDLFGGGPEFWSSECSEFLEFLGEGGEVPNSECSEFLEFLGGPNFFFWCYFWCHFWRGGGPKFFFSGVTSRGESQIFFPGVTSGATSRGGSQIFFSGVTSGWGGGGGGGGGEGVGSLTTGIPPWKYFDKKNLTKFRQKNFDPSWNYLKCYLHLKSNENAKIAGVQKNLEIQLHRVYASVRLEHLKQVMEPTKMQWQEGAI